jgi:hypothetical protein
MNKRNYSYYLLLLISIVTLHGCTDTAEGFLDAKEETETLEMIFADSLKTMQFQASVYWKIPDVVMGPRNPGNGYYLQSFFDYDSATDNGKESSSDRSSFAVAFSKADFTQDGINANFGKFLNSWTAMYQNIRVANQFLENYHKSPISETRKEILAAETRFLRAFYYFHLLRNWGGIPLVGDKMLDPFVNHGIPRSSFEETVNFIAAEFEAAYEALPHIQDGNNYGRPTKGAALGMLAKLYHLAASPLYNGGNTGYGANRLLVGYNDFQLSRWEKAKDALETFFTYNESQNKLFELVVNNARPGYGFYEATTRRVSKERVWMWVAFAGHTWPHEQLLPASRSGMAKVLPFHDLTEAFPTKDGKEIRTTDARGAYITIPGKHNSSNSLYDPNNPYSNRDPRLYYTVLFNDAKWAKARGEAPQPVYTYRGAASDGIFTGSTSTGYYYVKLCKENVTGKESGDAVSGHAKAFIRYADMMLMYAEVLAELNMNAHRNTIEDQLFQIRHRAGIQAGGDNRYGIPENMNKDEMIAFIINERRIEFALEAGNRYWDLKRRKLFENLNGNWSHAAIWEKMGEDNGEILFSWSVQPVEQHLFEPKMYHFPVPLKEIEASHATLIQNPGW